MLCILGSILLSRMEMDMDYMCLSVMAFWAQICHFGLNIKSVQVKKLNLYYMFKFVQLKKIVFIYLFICIFIIYYLNVITRVSCIG